MLTLALAVAMVLTAPTQAPATPSDQVGKNSPVVRHHDPDEANKKFAALHQSKAAPAKHKHQMHQSAK